MHHLKGGEKMEGSSMVTDLLSTVQTDVMSSIGDALPVAGGVFAAVAGIFIGIKIFKRITGARS